MYVNFNDRYFYVFSEQKLKQQLFKIRTNVGKFQRELTDVKPSPECMSFFFSAFE